MLGGGDDEQAATGWSQQSLGDRAKIDRSILSRVDLGGKNFTLEVLWRLANTLQVHWADLLDDRTTDVPEAPRTSTSFEQRLHAFGTRVYQARVLQRLSQQALADRIGIGPSTIYWVEDGTRNVTVETLSRLAAGLGVPWAELLEDRQSTPAHPDRSCDDVESTPGHDQLPAGLGLQEAAENSATPSTAWTRRDWPG